MSIGLVTLIIFLFFLLFMALGLPIAFCLFGTAIVFALIFVGPSSIYLLFSITFSTMTTDIFMAIPLFIFMAYLIQFSGIATALYDTMYKWFGPLRGGLAMGTVAICTLIAGMTGLGATGTVTMGVIALPEMLKRGYDKEFAVGCIPTGGALGPLIPPSVPMVVTAALAQLSVGKMFIGGIVPGLLIALLCCLYIGIRAYVNPRLAPALPSTELATWREKFISLRGVSLPVLLVIAVIGSIYSGAATPTEAAGVGAMGAIICAIIYRKLSWPNLKEAMLMTVKVNGMVLWLLAGGLCLGSLLGATGVSHWISKTLSGLPLPQIIIIAIMQLVVFIMGMFMDGASITVITIPLFIPVVESLGFNPLWFCLLFTINGISGYITPPFGMNLFYMKGVVPKDIDMGLIYRSVIPYVLIIVFVMVLCFVFPGILLWLPELMMK
jgi:tripartite ATP-independent transporter DctM subunit